ncbi:DNA cytosine methyltransferase [Catellatospora sp. TT07R-123]|uniref:DNA cytosine methyltransferase n=1 Tax=Catellatospora sp. TT07R-123 TaxID=2733863 RepID=UPI001B07BB9F|nr:DNA cytosine methyltransferase [Catellatospora sp. TT07R-123]GHJ45870.1 DNA cytosine methyltransferase [Catellatospora sp. TT07R-123]
MTLTLLDMMCGAGGSTRGATLVDGVQALFAINHWPQAIATHHANFPTVAHDCADISQVDPRRYPSTDLLWASPECTNHTQAKGIRDADKVPDVYGQTLPWQAAERSRATMWDVVRFAEARRLAGRPYLGMVIENVIEVVKWLPYRAWLLALRDLGYCLHQVHLNSMFAQAGGPGAPQSRDRWYCVAHLATLGRCPDLDTWARPLATCDRCGITQRPDQDWKRPDRSWGRYGTHGQYVWACPTPGCGRNRVHPSVLPAATAIDLTLTGTRIGDRPTPLAAKTMARITDGLRRHTRHTDAKVTVPPIVVPLEGRATVAHVRPVDQPLRAQTGRHQDALVVPMRNHGIARPAATHPLPTVTAAGNHHALLTWPSLLLPYHSNGRAHPTHQPMATLTTRDRYALIDTPPAFAIDPMECDFRMLEPSEIAAGMAFDADYQILGTRRARVRQAGNAVTPPAARDLIASLVELITGHTPTFTGNGDRERAVHVSPARPDTRELVGAAA